MLGVTGILVGTVFLTSIFLQTVLGFSALRDRARVPAVRARHHRRHRGRPAPAGPRLTARHRHHRSAHHRRARALLLSTAGSDAHYATDILPGLSALGLGVGMVFVPVSVTSMAGIPASHAGVASGFLMTGHEIGAALGVAVLSAVASTAGTPHHRRPVPPTRSPAGSSAPPSSAPSSRSSRCSGCPRPRRPAAAATCTCTETRKSNESVPLEQHRRALSLGVGIPQEIV